MADSFTPHYNLTLPENLGDTGIWGPLLNGDFSTIDSVLWSASQGTNIGVNAPVSSATNITLTNPLSNVQNISFSAANLKLILSIMNDTSSLVLGGSIQVYNAGSNAFSIYANDGSTVILSSLAAGATVLLTLITNSTANGTFNVTYVTSPNVPNTWTATQSFYGAALNLASAGNLASASTVNIGAAAGNFIIITGTTTINSFDTVQAGTVRDLEFTGILTLTYNATSLILPGAVDIITAVGDTATFVSLGSGNWLCQSYLPVVGYTTPAQVNAAISSAVSVKVQVFSYTGSTQTYTPSAGMAECTIEMVGGGGGGGGQDSSGHNYGSSGGSAAYIKALLTSSQISTSQVVTIGAAGIAGTTSGTNGGTGGTTSLGSLLSCTGGVGGTGNALSGIASAGGAGGTPTVTTGTSIIALTGQAGSYSYNSGSTTLIVGAGGSNPLGYGAPMLIEQGVGLSSTGLAATGFGSGGGGGSQISGPATAGSSGQPGYMIITEYCT